MLASPCSAQEKTLTSANQAELIEEGRRLSDSAWQYQSLGQYERALPLYQRALSIAEKTMGAGHPNTGDSLNSLAMLYRAMGRYEQALPLVQRALAISEDSNGPEHLDTGAYLNTLAMLYRDMSLYERALPLFQRSLAISERSLGSEHARTGTSLNNLAALHADIGNYGQALPLHQRALAISERLRGPEHPGTGISLNNLALLYLKLGRDDLALPLFERAQTIFEKVYGSEHPNTASLLSAIAGLYGETGRFEEALTFARRALAISEKLLGSEHPDIGKVLVNLGGQYRRMGRYEEALPFVQRALVIAERAFGVEHPVTAGRVCSLAAVYWEMGRRSEALALWQRVVPIALSSDSSQRDWGLLTWLRIALESSEPVTAVFWGKQSVNAIQSVRAGLSALDRDTQKSFLIDKRHAYTGLADLLVAHGRIIEAQRVMELLKEEEFFDFIRRDGGADPRQTRLPLTGQEQAASERLVVVSSRLGALFIEHERLQQLQRRGGLEEAERQRLAVIGPEIASARAAFDDFVASLSRQLAAQGGERSQAVTRIESHQNLLENLGEAGKGVAAVQYIASPEQLSIIVSTTAGQQAVQIKFKEAELNRSVANFRDVVQDRRLDPRPLGRELAKQLLDPIAATLQQQGVHTLLLMLDGTLRYLPFAALVAGDGRYLVQHYQLAVYTEAAASSLVVPPKQSWQVAALGVTKAFPQQNFSALPAVSQELGAIVRPEVLPGTTHLDDAFTLNQFKASRGKPVLHIASHFRFLPGSDESFLLLGDGSGLTLRQLRTELPRLTGVDLLTLSACETAVGGGNRADGREVEGLGVLAQRQGARAVLASLWPVGDASTGELMAHFYRQRQAQSLNKAQALRQAQLTLLQEGGSTTFELAQRGSSRPSGTVHAPEFKTDPARPYAHPFYWAPFVLMGNWL